MKFYELLDVSPFATAEEVKAAYRIQVHLLHPDRLRQANDSVRNYAEERLKKINEAYATLNDPVKRAAYDAVHLKAKRGGEAAEPIWRTEDDEARAAEYPEYYGAGRTGTGSRRRKRKDADDWMRQEAEARRTEEFMARQRRAAEEAERKRQEDEERARHAARTRYPRSAVHGNLLVCTLTPGHTIDLVRVPSGEFLMGSDPARDTYAQPSERPQHRVRVSEYFIARAPITWHDFARYRAATRLEGPAMPPGHDTHPVTQVSWDDAIAFCHWLSGPGWKYRLPTEAEWEKAARGGNAQLFPWGDAWSAERLNADHRHTGTTPIGAYSPAGDSPYGLQDMLGNVWEWCRDWYDADTYAQSQVIQDPVGPTVGDGAVIRGGAFDSPRRHARAAARNWDYPFKRRANVGFRVVAEAVVEP